MFLGVGNFKRWNLRCVNFMTSWAARHRGSQDLVELSETKQLQMPKTSKKYPHDSKFWICKWIVFKTTGRLRLVVEIPASWKMFPNLQHQATVTALWTSMRFCAELVENSSLVFFSVCLLGSKSLESTLKFMNVFVPVWLSDLAPPPVYGLGWRSVGRSAASLSGWSCTYASRVRKKTVMRCLIRIENRM